MRALTGALLAVWLCSGQEISGERIRAHVRFLSHDLLEGRGAGQRGGELATEYLATQLAVAGAKPGAAGGSWFQPVLLTGVTTDSASRLAAGALELKWLEEFVGQTQTRHPEVRLAGELVFAGHGITAPEFGWDDYRGADVKGKIVIVFTNEPASKDAKFFGGEALTYYGRWTYKFEEAARRGAAAALIIHTTPTAGYGWEVVRNSWGREDAQGLEGPLGFAGWVHEQAGAKLLALSGRKLEDALKQAGTRGFRAVPLGLRLSGTIRSRFRQIATRNVAGRVRGGDLEEETVIYTAHWDHLGKDPAVEGDQIFNGAVDNATGCGMLVEMARAWAQLEPRPRRSALFLFTTAEEAGLRGAEYYVAQPLAPLGQTALVLNFDSFYPEGRAREVVLDGAERTSFWAQAQEVAARFRLQVAPDPRPGQGSFFRSDHFPFAKAGVAAFSVKMAGSERGREYNSRHYHQPSDEYREEWDFSGLEEVARFGVALGQAAANADRRAEWITTAPGRR